MARRLTDPGAIAQRLGVPQEAIRRLQRRGFLQHLELDDAEIRERLFRAHVAFVLRQRLGASHRAVQLEDHGHVLLRVLEQTTLDGKGTARESER